ncbi:hypothetical protein TPHA_0F00980 [Tetrapisispora phaffii CBS 4417]|uniref:AAA+ ATPase domain-containing protein n=1 Tax=Tetrapisispora phaffii (strain ATCC 24235 / CBS 4417 / NBRC 1672 / NRRL Y-8282 / UCD 70-5) TaxID=1071381 RepID=G8BV02_TETPH|nr:hypothetical protein TPHA_0F00980 [Tetrapisispora phaffii CBS 4417]CCE63584.1 hypothetical protein TPHA_0F00980 [Tetrapisispora phaffii CBS 4417]
MARKIDIKAITDICLFVGAGLSTYFLLNRLLSEEFGGYSSTSKENKEKQKKTLEKLIAKNPELNDLYLDHYENSILSSVILSEDIDTKFEDIGGLDELVSELNESVVYPLMVPELFESNSLLRAPNGVLLYGPPGCGKTMLAKALAKESGANFISLRMSSIMDKWYGESNKIVNAIFSLANKIQPCMIFIDEIDSFLRERSSTDHEVTANLKAEFMTLWDGLISNGRVMLIGATNRMNDIDSAFLRRLPKRFYITLPSKEQRLKILEVLLKDTKLDSQECDIDFIAQKTEGLSGSDLKELCREAALNAAKEYIRNQRKSSHNIDKNDTDSKIRIRPLKNSDFLPTSQLESKSVLSSMTLD